MKASRFEPLLTRRSLLRAGLVSGLPGVFATSGIGSEEQFTRVVNESDRLLQALESIPYVAEGRGIPVYVLMSQTCPFCKALWRDHGKVKASIQFRWIPLPYTKDDKDQLAHVLKSRSAQDFGSYMTKSLRADDLQQDSEKVELYSRIIKEGQIVRQILSENGQHFGTPMFVWEKNGVLESLGGYDDESFRALVRHLSA